VNANLNEICSRVCRMPSDGAANSLVKKHGLAIQTVSWEDCARHKNSAWGPCISDMTLQVEREKREKG
jgi:hypothetical protein